MSIILFSLKWIERNGKLIFFVFFFESTHEIAKDETAGIKKGVEQCVRVVGAALILFLCGDGCGKLYSWIMITI